MAASRLANFQKAILEDIITRRLNFMDSQKKHVETPFFPRLNSYVIHIWGQTLEDLLNDYILPRLEGIRKQQPPKVLFARPETGPSSVEMDL